MELSYFELSRAKVGDHEDVVISQTAKDGEFSGYSVSKCVEAKIGSKTTKMFLKHGLGILSENALMNLYNAIGDALTQIGAIEYGKAIEHEAEFAEQQEQRFSDLGEDDKYW